MVQQATPSNPGAHGKHFHAIEITGQDASLDAAIHTAIAGAAKHVKNMRWYEVVSIRGRIKDSTSEAVQVTLKIGYEDEA